MGSNIQIKKNIDKEFNSSTVAFLTLGCKVNSYETEAMQKLFEDEGLEIVEFSQKADIYVINTCTVTNIADRKSRQMLHKARKMNEKALVVAVGCYVQAAKDTLELDAAIDVVIGNNKKKDIIGILKEHFGGNTCTVEQEPLQRKDENSFSGKDILGEADENKIFHNEDSVIDISHETEYEELNIREVSEKTRAYIKIQDGCNQFCSYCIIPYARGRVRSRSQSAVIEEVKRLVEKGYKEIVLTGIHLSSYGIDFREKDAYEEESLLLKLIVSLHEIEGLQRIRLGSLEPRIITENFASTLSKLPKMCPHFHLSLQSGCDATLKRMNRKYTAQEYYEKCLLLRKYFEAPAITTDIIVGFPGETEEEFLETQTYLRKISFAQMHVFKYSVRKGTKAETMSDQVKEEVKAQRSNALIQLAETMTKEYQSCFEGKTEIILIEEAMVIDGITYQVGHNERYLKLAVKSEEELTNQLISAKVCGYLSKEIMFCEIMD
jgi:threonylcarbamoyladenosine tRNA methylthiotransferase MtaB